MSQDPKEEIREMIQDGLTDVLQKNDIKLLQNSIRELQVFKENVESNQVPKPAVSPSSPDGDIARSDRFFHYGVILGRRYPDFDFIGDDL